LSNVIARWRRIPFAASLREFYISRGKRTRWPTSDQLDAMDASQFEAYIHAVGLDKKIAIARANRQGESHTAPPQQRRIRDQSQQARS
jgi:hypothetical protein